MPRPTWKGSLGFGLVQVPVELYPATQEDDVDFHMLDKRDLSPVGYQRINKKTKKEVAWGDIVKAVEVKGGKYVVVGPGDLRAAHPKATKSIEITDFVDASEISPMRWSTSYFVAPAKKSSPRAYAVLRDALETAGKVGIAKIVLRTRQHLCAVTVEDSPGAGVPQKVVVLAMLRFDTELRDAGEIDTLADSHEVKATKKEIDLAEKLIETLGGEWKPSQYEDDYQEALKRYIADKVKKGKTDEVAEEVEETPKEDADNVFDLVAALKQSLSPANKNAKAKKTTAKTKAAPKKKATRPRASKRTTRKAARRAA
jgi:DNA end-binding protein Ku